LQEKLAIEQIKKNPWGSEAFEIKLEKGMTDRICRWDESILICDE